MARSVNKTILLGHLGADPELRYTQRGTAVCTLSLATNESYRDKGGDLVEKTQWHRVVAWDQLAEICNEYLKKGARVYFEGSLQTRSWEDQSGTKRYTTEVKAREMLLLDALGGSSGGGSSSGSSSGGDGAPPHTAGQSKQKAAANATGDEGIFEPDHDLPF